MKTTESKTGALHIWLKKFWRFLLPSGDTCLVIPADPVKTHLGSILFISTRVAVDVASKEKDLVRAALTGSGCHLRNVKIISRGWT